MPLPKDPLMLLSYINMKLRDQYASLQDLSEDLGVESKEIERQLAQAGFQYSPEYNKFW